jgi:hypothetical protein
MERNEPHGGLSSKGVVSNGGGAHVDKTNGRMEGRLEERLEVKIFGGITEIGHEGWHGDRQRYHWVEPLYSDVEQVRERGGYRKGKSNPYVSKG